MTTNNPKAKAKAPAKAKATAAKNAAKAAVEAAAEAPAVTNVVVTGPAKQKSGPKARTRSQADIAAAIDALASQVNSTLEQKAEVEATLRSLREIEKPSQKDVTAMAEAEATLNAIRVTRKTQRRRKRNLHRESATPIPGCEAVCCASRQE